MKVIILKHGEQAFVDDEDFERLNVFKWTLLKSRKTDKQGYAVRSQRMPSTGLSKTFFMHHDVLSVTSHDRVDHKNGIKLDNQKTNLRFSTGTQNAGNTSYRKTVGRTSTFKGVSWHKRIGKWQAQLMTTVASKAKCRYLGYFTDERDAARAYNDAASEYFGEFAVLNVLGLRSP